jgi:hypothetical protein
MCTTVSKLSQAAAIRGEELTLLVMDFLQGMPDMLHNKRRKSKGENSHDFKILHARNDASRQTGFT